MVWYGMVWHGMAWHGMVWYGMVDVFWQSRFMLHIWWVLMALFGIWGRSHPVPARWPRLHMETPLLRAQGKPRR